MNAGAVLITLGNGADLGITKDNQLFITDYTNYRIDLGKATTKRIEAIQEYLERLKIHAVE